MNALRAQRIVRLVLQVRDIEATAAFYEEALGFTRAAPPGPEVVALRLGRQEIALARAAGGNAVRRPADVAADDPAFQHFAIPVSDMAAAYDHLSRFAFTSISRGGPQALPASTGSVTAFKFRDPEGHPLELSYIPGSTWLTDPPPYPGAAFLGVDHTALACADLEASVACYRRLGFTEGPRFLNTGPEQDRLDGLEGVVLDIATLQPPGGGPHIELLHYRSPAPPRSPAPGPPQGVAATCTVLAERPPGANAAVGHDPDGHRLHYEA